MRVRREKPRRNSASKLRTSNPPSSWDPPGVGIIAIRAACSSASVSGWPSRISRPSMGTVCSSVFPSPAATNRELRVVLRCSGRSKLTHESTRYELRHLPMVPIWQMKLTGGSPDPSPRMSRRASSSSDDSSPPGSTKPPGKTKQPRMKLPLSVGPKESS